MSTVTNIMKEALLNHVKNNDLTVSQLRKIVSDPTGAFLGKLSVNELLGGKSKAGRGKAAAASGAAVDTRSNAGLVVLDGELMHNKTRGLKDTIVSARPSRSPLKTKHYPPRYDHHEIRTIQDWPQALPATSEDCDPSREDQALHEQRLDSATQVQRHTHRHLHRRQ